MPVMKRFSMRFPNADDTSHTCQNTPINEGNEVEMLSNVVFLLFLEPAPHSKGAAELAVADGGGIGTGYGTIARILDRLVDFAVRHLQPSPAMAHVELIVPKARIRPGSTARRTGHFATYIGDSAGWKNEGSYYTNNVGLWHAIPIFDEGLADSLISMCDECVGAPYDVFVRYLASGPFPFIAKLLSENPQSPAHCGIISARALRMSSERIAKHALWRQSSRYCPSRLYIDSTSWLQFDGSDYSQSEIDAVIGVRGSQVELVAGREASMLCNGGYDAENTATTGAACVRAVSLLCRRLIDAPISGKALVERQLGTALVMMMMHMDRNEMPLAHTPLWSSEALVVDTSFETKQSSESSEASDVPLI
jgi:hypothetical protein